MPERRFSERISPERSSPERTARCWKWRQRESDGNWITNSRRAGGYESRASAGDDGALSGAQGGTLPAWWIAGAARRVGIGHGERFGDYLAPHRVSRAERASQSIIT